MRGSGRSSPGRELSSNPSTDSILTLLPCPLSCFQERKKNRCNEQKATGTVGKSRDPDFLLQNETFCSHPGWLGSLLWLSHKGDLKSNLEARIHLEKQEAVVGLCVKLELCAVWLPGSFTFLESSKFRFYAYKTWFLELKSTFEKVCYKLKACVSKYWSS